MPTTILTRGRRLPRKAGTKATLTKKAATKKKPTVRSGGSKLQAVARKQASPSKTVARAPKKRRTAKRELINTGTDKRYVRRRPDGTFKESDDLGKSLAADRRRKAMTKAPKGQKDRGD